jgi:hypothetical protein
MVKITLNAKETRVRNKNTRAGKFRPATLEIRYDGDDEHGLTVGLIVTADRRDLEDGEGNVVHLKVAWSTPREFGQWLGHLVTRGALLGLTDSDDEK